MSRNALGLFAAAIIVAIGVVGCGQKSRPEVAVIEEERGTTKSTPDTAKPEPTRSAESKPTASTPPPRDKMHQSFTAATLDAENAPQGDNVPPPANTTLTGKNCPGLCDQVAQAWDGIRYVTLAGQKIEYTAEIHTTRGMIKLALMPDIAPNHVRNFIALARVGYYDGLRFDRVYKHEETGEPSCIEAGCPLGSGETGAGSLGYWLKDELTPAEKLSHTPGVVGACKLAEADTAATKFYINLTEARGRDGGTTLFAVVLDGLDVARTIGKQPTSDDRPTSAVVIHKVVIHENVKPAGEK